MATLTPSLTELSAAKLGGPRKIGIYTWGPLTSTDTVGAAVYVPMYPDRSIQIIGTFGAGTLLIEGSNNDTDYATLTDQSDNALSFTAAKIEAIAPVTLAIRPRVTGADGTTSLYAILLVKGAKF